MQKHKPLLKISDVRSTITQMCSENRYKNKKNREKEEAATAREHVHINQDESLSNMINPNMIRSETLNSINSSFRDNFVNNVSDSI